MTNTMPSVKKKVKGRTFQCTGYPDCNMTFTRSEHLARHIRKHTGERPFECVYCARKFSRLDNLRQHKQTVHAHEPEVLNGKIRPNELDENDHQHPQINEFEAHNGNNENGNNYYHQNQQDGLNNSSSNLPDAATNLLRPTQFRSKHRPRPIALPSRKSIYNDAPYTVPTPRSATSTSNHLLLSPISPANSVHQFNSNYQNTSSALPSVQFLTSNGSGSTGDSLISPYNSSFSSNISNANTPTNSSFDSSARTPTNHAFTFGKPMQSSYMTYYDQGYHNQQQYSQQQPQQQSKKQHLQPNSQQSTQISPPQQQQPQQQPPQLQHTSSSSTQSSTSSTSSQPQRRSWLNNVLNNEGNSYAHQSPNAQNTSTTVTNNNIQSNSSPSYSYQYQPILNPKISHDRQPSNDLQQNSRVRIENLLNSSSNSSTSTNTNSPNHFQQNHGQIHHNDNERIRLPHVKNLGIDISKN